MDKFILNVPKWQGELLFSKEVLVFAGIILLLIVGVLFCFWGYKYFRTVLFVGIGTVVCYASYLLVEPMTENLVVRMFLTVSLTFFGMCFVYFLDIVFSYILDRLRIRSVLGKRTYILAAVIGAAILGLTVYFYIWHDLVTVVAGSAVCLVFGLVFQHFKSKKHVRFKCYNDLLRLKRPELDEAGLAILAPGTMAALMPVAAALTPKQEAETEGKPEAAPLTETAPVESDPISEPEAEAEPEAETAPVESDPISEPEAEAEPEAETAPVESDPTSEPEAEAEPEAETAPVESDPISEPEAEPEAAATPVESEPELTAEEEPAAAAFSEIADEEDILEEAFFVRKLSEHMKDQHRADVNMATAAMSKGAGAMVASRRKTAEVMNKAAAAMSRAAEAMNRAAEASAGDEPPEHHQKPHKKQDKKLVKGVAAAAVGLGLFIAGRKSKGGD